MMSTFECLPPELGEISLTHKTTPTHNIDPAERGAIVCLSCRSTAVSAAAGALRARVLSDGDALWATNAGSAARRTNTFIARPYHDRLGIGNVPFIFCDDNVHTVYHCPWYREWRPLLLPIFAAIGVDEARVVRCVLARLPPGVSIPPHHDSGHWVAMTHRMHCAIVTDPAVVFSAGTTDRTLQRHHLPLGALCELNNAAKHAVDNGSSIYRVHMMFDYVDGASVEDAPISARVVALAPGTELKRVGRAIVAVAPTSAAATDGGGAAAASASAAAASAAPLPPPPRPLSFTECALSPSATSGGGFYVIVGAMKCGTSSLYDYITQHPRALPAIRKELHFFDWKWDSMSRDDALLTASQLRATDAAFSAAPRAATAAERQLLLIQRRLCCMLRTPLRLFSNPTLVAGEATPSYCLGGSAVARRIRRVAPHARLIFTVRDPVARAWSQWNMVKGSDPDRPIANVIGRSAAAAQSSFAAAVESDIATLASAGLPDDGSGACDDDAFDAAYMATRPARHGSHSYVGRGLYAAQLRVWLRHFPREQILVLPLSALSTRSATTRTMHGVFQYLGLDPFDVTDTSHKNKRHYAKAIPDAVRQRLEAYYAPHNAALREMFPEVAF